MVSIVRVLVLNQIVQGTAQSHPTRRPSSSGLGKCVFSCRFCARGRQRVRSLLPESTGSLTYRTSGRYNHLQSYYLITLIAGHLWANLVCALANMITPAPSYLAAQQEIVSGPNPILIGYFAYVANAVQHSIQILLNYICATQKKVTHTKKVTFALFGIW